MLSRKLSADLVTMRDGYMCQVEREHLIREKQLREEAQKEKEELQQRMQDLQEQFHAAQEAMVCSAELSCFLQNNHKCYPHSEL